MAPPLAQRHPGVKGASRGLGGWSSVRDAGGAVPLGTAVLTWDGMGGAGAGAG